MARILVHPEIEVDFREPKRGDFPPKLGGAVAFTLAHMLYHVLSFWGEQIAKLQSAMFAQFFDLIEPDVADALAPVLSEIEDIPGLPSRYKTLFSQLRKPRGLALLPVIIGALISLVMSIFSIIIPILITPLIHAVNRQIEPARPGPADAIAILNRNPGMAGQVEAWLDDQGWPRDAVEAFKSIYRRYPSAWELFDYEWRVDGQPENVKDELMRQGYSGVDADKLIELASRIPGVQDIIRFAVREVWKPEVIAKWGYDEEFPGEFETWAKRLGYSPDWALAYWRAHWELPSPFQAAEMVWRGAITEADYMELLRIQDYPPAWREAMMVLIKTPVPRVDLRRMYKYGMVSEGELPGFYGKLGYDKETAILMAGLAVKMGIEDESEYTKGEVLRAYRLGAFKYGEALATLIEAGYSPDYAERLLAWEDYKEAKEVTDDKIDIVKARFIKGLTSEQGAWIELNALDLEGERANLLMEKWRTQRVKKDKALSETRIKQLYTSDIISTEQAEEAMAVTGYPDDSVTWIMSLWEEEQAEKARKEVERANKERERIEAQEIKTTYQRERARIEVAIAEEKAHIAELKLALRGVGDSEIKRAIDEAVAQARIRIAEEKATAAMEELAIAEANLALFQVVAPEQKRDIMEYIATAKFNIAEAKYAQANLNLQIAETKLGIFQTATPAQREAIQVEIATAKVRISALELERSQLKLEVA